MYLVTRVSHKFLCEKYQIWLRIIVFTNFQSAGVTLNLSSYSIRILMTHSLTHSTKSVFKSTHTFRTYQHYHPCYSFNVPHLKFDLRKQIFEISWQKFHYRNLPESPSEYQIRVWVEPCSPKSLKVLLYT